MHSPANLSRACRFVIATALCGAGSAQASERYRDFLHGLQQRGYGELAVYYLQTIGAGPARPDELREAWDLEMANSLRMAASEARTLQERQQLEQQAKTHLDAFSQQHPSSPAVLFSFNAWGATSLERGIARAGLNNTGRSNANLTPKAAALAKASLEEASHYFQETLRRHRQLTESLPADDESAGENLRGPYVEARLRLCLVNYWTAQLLRGANQAATPDSIELLKTTAAEFQKLDQEFEEDQAGLVAGYWHARCLADLGDNQGALEACDDVLGFVPGLDEDQVLKAEQQFFAEVLVLRLQTLAKENRDGDIVSEASGWVKARSKEDQIPGSEAIVLELAKARLRLAGKLPESEQRAAQNSAFKLLARVAGLPGTHQYEALRLYRSEPASGRPANNAAAIAAALTFARLAEQQQNWPEVEQAYRDAIADLASAGDAGELKLTDVQELLAAARLHHAQLLLSAGDDAQAIEVVELVMRELPKTAAAPRVAALAVAYAKRRYLQADESERPDLFEQLAKLCGNVITHWPTQPEADDARLTMAQATVASGDIEGAVKLYCDVPQTSPRYRVARLAAGQLLWREYQEHARKASQAEPDPQRAGLTSEQAEQLLRSALGPDGAPPAADEVAAEASVLLAQLLLKRQAASEARQLLAPLIARLNESQLTIPSPLTLRLVHVAARVDLACGDAAAAENLTLRLARVAGDVVETNNVLVDLLRSLSPPSAASAESEPATSPGIRELANLLARRKQLSPLATVIVADACLGDNSQISRELYQALLELAGQDEAVRQSLGPHLTRVRTRLVRLLCDERQFVLALKQVDELLAAQPRQLELWMEKGRILQSCAAGDPKYLETALAHWTEVRRILGSRRSAEYFEAGYYAAYDLYRWGQHAHTPERLQQAEQLLKAILVTAPKLSGEAMVKQYQELLDKIRDAQAADSDKAA